MTALRAQFCIFPAKEILGKSCNASRSLHSMNSYTIVIIFLLGQQDGTFWSLLVLTSKKLFWGCPHGWSFSLPGVLFEKSMCVLPPVGLLGGVHFPQRLCLSGSWPGKSHSGRPILVPGWGILVPLEPRREGWSFVSAKQKKAGCGRIQLHSGSAGLARLAIVFLVLLLKSLLGRSEDMRGYVGKSSESLAWLSEMRLTLSRGPGEFYPSWPRLYDEALVFTFMSGYLQIHFKERGGHYILDDSRKKFRLSSFLNKIPEHSRSLHKSPINILKSS